MTTMTRPAEALPAPTATRRPWVALLGAILLLTAGFGGGFLVARLVQEDPAGLAGEDSMSVIQGNMTAFNDADVDAVKASYSEGAVFTVLDRSGVLVEYEGPDEIWREMGGSRDLVTTSELVQQGGIVAATYSEAFSSGVVTFEIAGGRIVHQWILIDQLIDPPANPNRRAGAPVSWAGALRPKLGS